MFICGHYEGYDERIRTLVTDEYSIGDFVLTGGELAATVMIDSPSLTRCRKCASAAEIHIRQDY